MSLFQCEVCGCCENTALSGQGCQGFPEKFYDWSGIEDRKGKKLCSEHAPTCFRDGSLTKFGKWHGQFTQRYYPMGEFKTGNNGNLEHIATGDQEIDKYEFHPT